MKYLCSLVSLFILIPLPKLQADTPHTFGHAAIEAGYSTNTTSFALGNKGIASLSGITNYTAAETILLYNNQISSIESGSFTGRSNLQTLYLDHNQLSSFDLSRGEFIQLNYFYARSGNTIGSVNLSDATLSQQAFKAIVQDLDGGGVTKINLNGADLREVTAYSDIDAWNDLQSLDLAFAALGSHALDHFTTNLAGLDHLTLSQDQWNGAGSSVQSALNSWNAQLGNALEILREQFRWTAAGGGDFQTAANWLENEVPLARTPVRILIATPHPLHQAGP